MKSHKYISLKKVGEQPYSYIYGIPEIKHKFYEFFFNYWVLGWFFKFFLKLMSFQVIIFSDLLQYFHIYSHKTDYVIAGENPLIALCLLKSIANRGLREQNKIKVLIVKFSNDDYWGYHAFEKAEQWEKISNILNKKVTSINQMIDFCISGQESNYLDITYLDSSSDIAYVNYDKVTNRWICFLKDSEKEKEDSFAKKMPTVLMLEKKIKENYWSKVVSSMFKLPGNFSILKQTKDQKDFIIFTDRLILSSYPQGWLNVKVVKKDNYSFFEHLLTKSSFGTSRRMANSFDLLDDQAVEDLKESLNSSF